MMTAAIVMVISVTPSSSPLGEAVDEVRLRHLLSGYRIGLNARETPEAGGTVSQAIETAAARTR